MKNQGKISEKEAEELRKKIKNKIFRSKSHLREYITEMKK
jgi:ribosomal protein L19E